MKKMAKMVLSSPVTFFSFVLGIVAVVTGIFTATGHNILIGVYTLPLGWVNYKQEQADAGEIEL